MFNIHPHSRAHSRPTVIATGSVVNAGVPGDNVGPTQIVCHWRPPRNTRLSVKAAVLRKNSFYFAPAVSSLKQ